MTPREKRLYHQIHPLKLWVDFGSSFASAWLLWQARWVPALLIAFLPSIAISAGLVRFADLERLRHSWFGSYVTYHMPNKIVAARIAGQLLVWAGAIAHWPWLVPLGYFSIVLAWLNGLWAPQPAQSSRAPS
jgi:hypothetical protein